jgi:hypothetical protein
MRCKYQELLAAAFAGVLVASCAGPATTIDTVWTSGAARAEAPLRRVVTVFISDNITLRHRGEDELARDLMKTGVEATPGYMVLSEGAKDMRDLEPMKARLRDMGYDGIVTMRIVDREETIDAMQSSFDGYWGYWGPYYWDPGYVYSETIYRIEASAYSLRSGRLLWSALTKTRDPDTAHELLEDTTEIIAGQLVQRGLAG